MKIIIKGNIFNLSVLWNNNIVIRHVIEKIIPYPPYLVCGNKYNHVKIGKVNIMIIKNEMYNYLNVDLGLEIKENSIDEVYQLIWNH